MTHKELWLSGHILDMQQNPGSFMPVGVSGFQRTDSGTTPLVTGCSTGSSKKATLYESPGLSSAEIRE